MKPDPVTKRDVGFWTASGIALSLSIMSCANSFLISGVNRHLFHESSQAEPGERLYVAVRLLLTVLLVWIIVRLPESPEASAAKPAARRSDRARVGVIWGADPDRVLEGWA